MNVSVAALAPVSRPKIHRLPPRVSPSRRHQTMSAVLSYGHAAKIAFTVSSLALAVWLAALAAGRVIPFALLQQDVPVKIETASILPASGSEVAASAATASFQGKTIILKGGQDMIVSQMAKMPPQRLSGETAIISEVDNARRQELLSIVNQY